MKNNSITKYILLPLFIIILNSSFISYAESYDTTTTNFQWKQFDKAYFIFVIDDSNEYLLPMYELFHSKNVPLSCGVIVSTLNTTYSKQDKTVKETLNLIVRDGGEVLAHYSENLSDFGYTDNIHCFKSDLNSWLINTIYVRDTLIENGFNCRGIMRANYTQLNSNMGEFICKFAFDYSDDLGISPQYSISRKFMHTFKSTNEVLDYIDVSSKQNGVYPFCFHGSESVSDLKSMEIIIDYIKSQPNCSISTYSNIYDTFASINYVPGNESTP